MIVGVHFENIILEHFVRLHFALVGFERVLQPLTASASS